MKVVCILLICSTMLFARGRQADSMSMGHTSDAAELTRFGGIAYLIGAPLTYSSIIMTIIGNNTGNFAGLPVMPCAVSGAVLNHTGMLASCVSARRAVKHLEASHPLRIEARKNLLRYLGGSLCALGSAAVVTAGGPISYNGDAPWELFLCTGLALFVCRDFFWAPAAVSSVRIADKMEQTKIISRLTVGPMMTHKGAVGACVSMGLR